MTPYPRSRCPCPSLPAFPRVFQAGPAPALPSPHAGGCGRAAAGPWPAFVTAPGPEGRGVSVSYRGRVRQHRARPPLCPAPFSEGRTERAHEAVLGTARHCDSCWHCRDTHGDISGFAYGAGLRDGGAQAAEGSREWLWSVPALGIMGP